MKRKIFFIIALLAAICGFSSCGVKATSDDVVLVVQDVIENEDGTANITFRNSDKVLNCNFKPFVSSGQVLLITPDEQYVVLAKNNHFDFIMVLVMVIFAFFAGCLITGRYLKRCMLPDDKDTKYYA